MRNPKNSWEKSDSFNDVETLLENIFESETALDLLDDALNNPARWFHLGDNDLALAHSLYLAGPTHRKFMRQIDVSMDIVAPLYWWKEFDTYKVGTVEDSCSTMHKIHDKEFVPEDFSHEHLSEEGIVMLDTIIDFLNENRYYFNAEKNKDYWWEMIQILPSSYNQRRTVTFNYENAASMINQRKNHKLDEWREFCDILLNELPYLKDIMGE
jgi:hypothetical protein